MIRTARNTSNTLRLSGAALLCVLAPLVWWTAQLSGTPGNMPTLTVDQFHYTVPAWRYAAQAVHSGLALLWNPYQLCGTPFLAAQLHGILYPLHWPIFFLHLGPAARLVLIVHGALAMGGAYWCARVFGACVPAALLAGAAYAFGGSVCNLGVASMEPALVSAAWLPWQLAFTRTVLVADRRWKPHAVGLGISMGMVILGGHLPYLQWPMYLCMVYTAFHLAGTARRKSVRAAARLVPRLVLATVVATGIAAVQLLPTVALMTRSPRRPGAVATPHEAGVKPVELLHDLLFPMPRFLGIPGEAHVGTAALALAVVPLMRRRTRRHALVLAVALAGALLIAFASRTPFYRGYLHVPAASWFRAPQRFLVVASLCIALLGALGADALLRQPRRALLASLTAASSMPLMLWLLLGRLSGWSAEAALGRRELGGHIAIFMLWAGLFLGFTNGSTRRWRTALVWLIAPLTVVELYYSASLWWAVPANRPDAVPIPSAAVEFIRSRPGWARTFVANSPDLTKLIPPKLGMLTGIPVISDYEPLFDARYAELLVHLGGQVPAAWSAYQGPFVWRLGADQWPLLRLLGVQFILRRRDAGVTVALAAPVFSDGSYDVYELADPLPRVYVASRLRWEPTSERALDVVVHDTPFILDGGAVLEGREDADLGATGSVEISDYAPQSVELHARLSGRGLVVLQDQFDPYWAATVDGRRAEVLRVNYVFRGVVVDAGAHVIRFTYRPTPVYVGAAITLMTVLALTWAAVRCAGGWRQKRAVSNVS